MLIIVFFMVLPERAQGRRSLAYESVRIIL